MEKDLQNTYIGEALEIEVFELSEEERATLMVPEDCPIFPLSKEFRVVSVSVGDSVRVKIGRRSSLRQVTRVTKNEHRQIVVVWESDDPRFSAGACLPDTWDEWYRTGKDKYCYD